jgi:hypothetical protein
VTWWTETVTWWTETNRQATPPRPGLMVVLCGELSQAEALDRQHKLAREISAALESVRSTLSAPGR